MNSRTKEFFRELDLEPDANFASVKQSYRQLVKVWHPDRFGSDLKLQAVADDKLKKINFAYESLVAFFENGGTTQDFEERTEKMPEEPPQTRVASEMYRQGLNRFRARDFKAALELFLESAEKGDANGQYGAGFILYQHAKRNVFTIPQQLKNDSAAFNLFRDAAEQGHLDAQYMVGLFFQYAYCTPYNGAEARRWLQRAASKGHFLAKERLNKLAILHTIRSIPFAKLVMEPPPHAPPPK